MLGPLHGFVNIRQSLFHSPINIGSEDPDRCLSLEMGIIFSLLTFGIQMLKLGNPSPISTCFLQFEKREDGGSDVAILSEKARCSNQIEEAASFLPVTQEVNNWSCEEARVHAAFLDPV